MELTDGVFAWPAGLAHYIDVHSVRLPEQFVQHAQEKQFVIPVDLQEVARLDYDLTFWSEWCQTEASSGWIDALQQARGRIVEWVTKRVT